MPFASLSRRRFARWLAASPLALRMSRQAAAAWNNVETPPAFRHIAPPSLSPVTARAKLFPTHQVRLLDGPFRQAQNWNTAYLTRLDPDRLLHTFRVNAGLPSTVRPLGGWEDPKGELRGHFMGHYLSGCAFGWAATGNKAILARGNHLVEELALCQQHLGQDGYLSAFPTSWFDRLAVGAQVWAPFYTYHKIFNGMLDMHEIGGNARALEVAKGMAGWTDRWTVERGEEGMQTVLEVEFGGMNDALYRLGVLTGDDHWLMVGDRFTKKRVFEPLASRKDQLRGLHMNTHVPQIIGAERRYALTGDRRFRDVSDFFWQSVTENRSYATGGASNNEHWLTEPNQLGAEWEAGHDHQESCCGYNMMKLGAQIFSRAPNAAIADYIEINLINHRLATIQPETGLTAYFLSLTPGAWKTWGTDDTTFWCCNGSALEDFSNFNRMIYAHDDTSLWVNLFIASTLEWPDHGVTLRQQTAFPAEEGTRLIIERSSGASWSLRLRLPSWAGEDVRVLINGEALGVLGSAGSYLDIRRVWHAGDMVEMHLPMDNRWEPLPDRPGVAALVHGPVVLARQSPLGPVPDNLAHEHGPMIDKFPSPQQPLVMPLDLPARLLPVAGQDLHFSARLDDSYVTFRPLFDSSQRYTVYSAIS